jgi:hypothetical protein
MPKNHTLEERNRYAIRVASEKVFCVRRGYIITEGYAWSCACAHLLLGLSCPPGGAGIPDPGCTPKSGDVNLKIWDHVSVYTRICDGSNVIVSQPYVPPADYPKVTAVIKAFCQKWGLEYAISNEESWHVPGRTLLIELSPPLPPALAKMKLDDLYRTGVRP